MKIKTKLLLAYLDERKLSVSDLANEMKIDVTELERLLNGEAADKKIARRFIYHFGASKARRFVDWEAIGKKDPFADKEDSSDEQI